MEAKSFLQKKPESRLLTQHSTSGSKLRRKRSNKSPDDDEDFDDEEEDGEVDVRSPKLHNWEGATEQTKRAQAFDSLNNGYAIKRQEMLRYYAVTPPKKLPVQKPARESKADVDLPESVMAPAVIAASTSAATLTFAELNANVQQRLALVVSRLTDAELRLTLLSCVT